MGPVIGALCSSFRLKGTYSISAETNTVSEKEISTPNGFFFDILYDCLSIILVLKKTRK